MTVEVVAWTTGLSAPATRVQVAETEIELRLAISAVDESLMVTASYVDTPLSLLADSVNTLSRADLDARQITTLGDALRLVPGFTVARNGGPGTVTSVFPRGGESDYTMVLVDGMRMNTFGGGMDLSQVSIAGAERVEVVRGPQSALYGSDAIGGVVQVLTSRSGDPMVDALVEGGGRDARRVAGSARASLGDVYGTLSGQYMEDDGYTGTAPADGSTVSNDDSRVSDVAAGLGWRRASGTDLFGTFQYLDSDRGSPGPYGSNPAGNFGGVDRTARSLTWRRSGAARLIQPLGGAASRVRLRAEADVAEFDLEYRDEFGSVGETTRGHGRLQADAAFADGLSASAGGEWVGESGRSTYILSNTGEVPVDRDVWAGFAEARWQPTARLSFTGGARASRITRAALPGDPNGFPPRPAFDDETIVAVNPKATAAWIVVPEDGGSGASTRLHAAAGTGIRPPDAFEIAFTDNAGLEPERSQSVEAGLTQTLLDGVVSVDATWFHNTYDDLIVSVGRFSSSSRYTHRQHRQRPGPRRRIGAQRAAVGPVLGAGDLHLSRYRDPRRGWQRRPGPVAVRRRRPAAAPPASPGQRGRRVGGRPGAAVRDGGDPRHDAGRRAQLRHLRRAVRERRLHGGHPRGIVDVPPAADALRPAGQRLRRNLRGCARISGARPHGLRGTPDCCRPLTSASRTTRPGRCSRA